MGNALHHPKGSRRDALRLFKANGGGSSSRLKTIGTSKNIVLPDGLPVVHAKLFFHSSTLRDIQIPSSVERIRFSAFEGCQALVVVDLAEGLKTIEIQSFAKCTSLQEIRIPSTVETIGISAFSQCTSLVVVDLQEGLQKIGSMAFGECTSLVTMAVPSSVKVIAARAFEKCSGLVEAYLPSQSLTKLEEGLFASCCRLERIQIPCSVKVIRREALAGCTSLVQVEFFRRGGLQTIEALAFWKCHKIKDIYLPPTVETVEFLAFSECHRLTEVSLPNGLKVVNVECFGNCTLLQKINFPTSVTQIMERAFTGCTRLTNINLVEGLKSIERGAFSECLSLAAIHIPSTVERIAYEAFSNCQSLICIEISASSSVELSDGAFVGCQSLVNICIPKATRAEKYANLESWRSNGCPSRQQEHDCPFLKRVLQTRFDEHPVHFQCYHASETTPQELRHAIQSFEWEHESDLVDSFGMTPFHILFGSTNARMDLLLVLLEAFSPKLLDWKDNYGKRAEEYLSNVWMDGSRPMMQLVLQKRLLDRLSIWGAHQTWRVEMEHKIHRLLDADDKDSRNKHLRGVNGLMKRYQQIELVALLELWLWKQKMQTEDGGLVPMLLDRASYRAKCGFSFVRPIVFGFLGSDSIDY
mmetsp:Transcript_41981/g.101165  ORF Transcript_41981/g.101165 Transcript_41981/m.101165 type:complete len:641 (-) Transcript_41981:436-2358(-)